MPDECAQCGEPLEEGNMLYCEFCAKARKFIKEILEGRL